MMLRSLAARWRGRNRRKFSSNDERVPRLTGRSCGEFPGLGRTLPSRHLPHLIACRLVGEPGGSVCVTRISRSPATAAESACSRNHPSSGSGLRHYDPFGPLYTVRFWAPLAVERRTPEFARSGPDSGLSTRHSAIVPHADSAASSPLAHPRGQSDSACRNRERCSYW